MMHKKIIFLLFVIYSVCQNAYAYSIKPTSAFNKHNRLTSKRFYFVSQVANQFSDPVHEYITKLAQKCSINPNCNNDIAINTDFDNDYMIVGVRWNDDPLYMIDSDIIDFLMKFNDVKQNFYSHFEYPELKTNLLAQSHFGELQFMHSMAYTNNIPAFKTKQQILEWLIFCYEVSNGTIKPDTKISNTRVENHFGFMGKEFLVQDLFDSKKIYRKDTKALRQIALGAMLHTIQDSFSKSHIKRDRHKNIIQFYAYSDQDESKHAHQDKMPSKLRNNNFKELDPLKYSIEILKVYQQSPNNINAIKIILEKIYTLDKKTSLSNAGIYEQDYTTKEQKEDTR